MKTTIARVGLAVAIGLGAAAVAAAQTPLSLTLDEAIARGVTTAPRLSAAKAREAAADATVASRSAAGLPSVTAMTSYMRTNHVDAFGIAQPDGSTHVLFPDIPDNYAVRAEADIPLVTSGRVSSSVASAQAEARAAGADRQAIAQDVRLDVTRAYWTLVTAREAVKVRQENLQRMDAWVGDVQARVSAGVLPPNDLLSAQAQRAHQNVQLIQAKNAADLAEVDLARLIGVDLSQPIDPTTPVDRPLPQMTDASNPVGERAGGTGPWPPGRAGGAP